MIDLPQNKESSEEDKKKNWYDAQKYYGYHRHRGHYSNQCLVLRSIIKGLLDSGKYTILPKANILYYVNVVINEEICANLRRGKSRQRVEPTTAKKLDVPKDPREYDMLQQLKNTQAKIIL